MIDPEEAQLAADISWGDAVEERIEAEGAEAVHSEPNDETIWLLKYNRNTKQFHEAVASCRVV